MYLTAQKGRFIGRRPTNKNPTEGSVSKSSKQCVSTPMEQKHSLHLWAVAPKTPTKERKDHIEKNKDNQEKFLAQSGRKQADG